MMIKSEDVIFTLGHDLLNDLGARSTGQIYHVKSAPPLRAYISPDYLYFTLLIIYTHYLYVSPDSRS